MNNGGKKPLEEFWIYVRPDRKACLFSLLLMLLTLVCELTRPFLMKVALDEISIHNAGALERIALIFLMVLVVEYFCRAGFNYLFTVALLKTVNRIREAVFHQVIRLKMSYFDHHPIGGLLTRTINDTEALRDTLRGGIATVLVDILTIVGMLAVMMSLDLGLSLAMAVTGLILSLLVRWFGKKLREQFLKVRSNLARSNAFMAEGIAGVEIIQLFGYRETSARQFSDINRDYRQATIWKNVYDASLYALVDAIAAIASALILYLGFGLRFGLLEMSIMIVYLNLIDRIFVPIRDLSGKFATIQQALAAFQRISKLLNTPEQPRGSKVIKGDQLQITFEDVCFSYGKDAPSVLHQINFTVKPGQTVALVGATGSGKSTIGRLLTRTYDGYRGRIFINDIELNDANFHSLRANIAVVHQDIDVYPGTIRDNITMFDTSIDNANIQEAIALVKAQDIIAQLPNGLDCEVKENGVNLSAGQLQLIVFARALAHKTPVILMDEATSNVDSLTEAWIQDAVQRIFEQKTVIIVAHRLSTISAADMILVMKEGRIVERGNHQELMQNPEGYYAKLVLTSQASV